MLRIFLLSMSVSFLAGMCFFTIRAEEELTKSKFVSDNANIRSYATETTEVFSRCKHREHDRLLIAN